MMNRAILEADSGALCQNRVGVATLPSVGIKSEDIKPVEGVTREEVEEFLDDLHELPPLPTSRKLLPEDGQRWRNDDFCGSTNTVGMACVRRNHRDDEWHVAYSTHVLGRWYTDGPFVEAK